MYGEADGTSGVCDKAGSDPTAVKKPESTSWPACLVIKNSTGNSDSDVMVEILRWLLRNAPLTLNIVPQCFILPGPQKTCLAEAGIVISVILCVCARGPRACQCLRSQKRALGPLGAGLVPLSQPELVIPKPICLGLCKVCVGSPYCSVILEP